MSTLFCIEALNPETDAWVRLDYPPFETALGAALFGISVLAHVDLTWRCAAIKSDEPHCMPFRSRREQ